MSIRLGTRTRWSAAVGCVALLIIGSSDHSVFAAEPEAMEFLRVHVPADRLSDVPLGTGRYVPMTLAEFRAALVDRSLTNGRSAGVQGSPPAMTVIADVADYQLEWSPAEGLRGTAEVTLGPGIDGLRRAIPLSGQIVAQASFASDAGTGAAEISGLADGSIAVIAEAEGRYSWEFVIPADASGSLGPAFRFPLVPAVFSSVQLRLPSGFVPLVKGAQAVQRTATPRATGGTAEPVSPAGLWEFELGPAEQLVVTIAAAPLPNVPLSCWSRVSIERQTATLTTTIVPATPWTTTDVQLLSDAGVHLVGARLKSEQTATSLSWRPADSGPDALVLDGAPAGDGIVVQLPTRAVGTRAELVVEAIAAFVTDRPWTLPTISPPPGLWAGGGVVAALDSRLVVERVEPVGCLPVDEEIVAGWPLDQDADSSSGPRMAFESQVSNASLTLTAAQRKPEKQVHCVTTVDISPGSVIAQAACEITVERGEIFEFTGLVAPGWLIDSVEIPGRSELADWRVEPAGEGSVLRIGLVNGVVQGGVLRVNVMGHRSPLREGEPFARSSLEMLSLGDAQAAAIEIRTNAEMTIDGAGQSVESVAVEQLPAGLRKLAGDTGVRLRLLVSDGDQNRMLRLLRRRPPIDVQTQVRLTVRDDRLTESFTLECSPRDAELDSVVVHLSEPTSDGMEWTLLPPTTGQLLARRFQPQEPRDPADGMESWLLELVPPSRGTITLRGVQAVPFTGPTNVPLAWVEGAASRVGELQIRDAGRRRPLVVNHTLSEIPGVAGDSERYATSVSRFLFDPVRDLAGGQAPARLVPGGDQGVAPRAWAWNETTTCWCHTSGVIEYETVFDIENHGRATIILSHPPDKQIQEILVDGVQLVAGVRETLGGETVIELPAGRRMIRLEIHALARARPLFSGWNEAWQVDPIAGVIDLPVLERLWQVGLPPGLQLAHVPVVHQPLKQTQVDWLKRLFGASLAVPFSSPSAANTADSLPSFVDGFQLHTFAPTSGRSTTTGVVLVSSWLVISLSLVSGLLAAMGTWFFSRKSMAISVAICGVTAVVALWAPFNAVDIVRVAWWGSLAGLAAAVATRRFAVMLALVCSLGFGGGGLIAAEPSPGASEPLRVFISGEAADATVLVPDRLFRELGRGVDAVESLGVRVERVTVAAAVPASADGADDGGEISAEASAGFKGWQLTVDLLSDANTVCILRQPLGGGQFVRGSLELDGGTAAELPGESLSPDGRILRVPLAVPGRHRLSVRVQPDVRAEGGVGIATIGLPVAPQAGLRIVEPDTAVESSSVLVERERNGLPVVSSAEFGDASGSSLDISRTDTLRLCWSLEPGVKLVGEPRVVAARNDVSWEGTGCSVVSRFQFDPGEGIFRSFVVAADPRLEPVAGALAEESEPVTVRRINDGRWLVERLMPSRGRATVAVSFAMPLADPVGVFRVPEVEIASADPARSARLVQFIPGDGYAATVRLPSGVTAGTPSDPSSGSRWFVWRREPSATETAESSPVVVTVSRAAAVLRGTQRMRLDMAGGRVQLRFDASIESVDAALASLRLKIPAAWNVQRLGLSRVTAPRTGSLQASPQDIHWMQADERTIDVICQRPRSGRFRIDLVALEPIAAADTGSLTVPQIDGLRDASVIVEWPTDDGVQVDPAGDLAVAPLSSSDWQSLEMPPGSQLSYRRGSTDDGPAAVADDESRETEPDRRSLDSVQSGSDTGDEIPRVELLDIRFATDDRGKAWGVARIDLVPASHLVRLQLPAGMRLFEVFVDEHPLRARPVGESAWELELLDVSRPRAILVIFAGDIGDQLVSGLPLRLNPPKLPGIPTGEVVWMIRGPRGLDIRVLAPSLLANTPEIAAIRDRASTRLEAALRRALEGRDPRERERIEEQVNAVFARTQLSAAEQAWNRTSLALSSDVYATTGDPDGGIIVRAAPRPVPTDSSRAVATAAAILVAGVAWSLTIRRPSRMAVFLTSFGPLIMATSGAAWLALLQPAWPGGMLLLLGGISLLRKLLSAISPSAGGDEALVIRESASGTGG